MVAGSGAAGFERGMGVGRFALAAVVWLVAYVVQLVVWAAVFGGSALAIVAVVGLFR